MVYTANDIAKVRTLVQAACAELQANGWTDEQIVPHLREFADKAVAFLAAKNAA